MASFPTTCSLFQGVALLLYELTFDLCMRFVFYLVSPSRKKLLYETLDHALTFEEYQAAAIQLDEVTKNRMWQINPVSRHYNYELIKARRGLIVQALDENDQAQLIRLLQASLVRNYGNITDLNLYNRAYSGTKMEIEDYVKLQTEAVRKIIDTPPEEGGVTVQRKMDLMHNGRQAYGRTCLVLQGGSIFGLCHLGVIKALHEQDMLPRIIAGTATGALMAALVATHVEADLDDLLRGDSINLEAFTRALDEAGVPAARPRSAGESIYQRFCPRTKRFMHSGYVLNVQHLEDCVRANVGDLTFEDAFKKTKRILNITITTHAGATPICLNYVTTPHILIWTAAMASSAPDANTSAVKIMCRNYDGQALPWTIPEPPRRTGNVRSRKSRSTDHDRSSPLSRVAELFNVNHYIVSQARPYLIPFLFRSPTSQSRRTSRESWPSYVFRMVGMELEHRLHQLDYFNLLPASIRRFLIDEKIPGSHITLVPQISIFDFKRLLRDPTPEEVDYWIRRGERSVWPAMSAIKVRGLVEREIERSYQMVRRRKVGEGFFELGRPGGGMAVGGIAGEKRKRARKKARTASEGAVGLVLGAGGSVPT